jgi:hypothetical protein
VDSSVLTPAARPNTVSGAGASGRRVRRRFEKGMEQHGKETNIQPQIQISEIIG